jgi:phosphoribosylglycinamide formyltransferase-1
VGVISHHEHGGVRKHAVELGIPFIPLREFDADSYRGIIKDYAADYTCLSGWLKLVRGLDPARTINIRPGPLPRFGGKRMYGHHVHEAVIEAYKKGEVTHSCVTMHFVDAEFDHGAIFFEHPVPILDSDTPETLFTRVNEVEHEWQPLITNRVVNDEIRLENGRVRVPHGYAFLPNHA